LHQVGDLFELNVKLRCQNVKPNLLPIMDHMQGIQTFRTQPLSQGNAVADT